MTEFTFYAQLAGLEIQVDCIVTDPGLAPRYGEDPDPGHEPEIRIEGTTYEGQGVCFSEMALWWHGRYVPVDEWLLDQAYDFYGRGIL
jgi:hypothetical protein